MKLAEVLAPQLREDEHARAVCGGVADRDSQEKSPIEEIGLCEKDIGSPSIHIPQRGSVKKNVLGKDIAREVTFHEFGIRPERLKDVESKLVGPRPICRVGIVANLELAWTMSRSVGGLSKDLATRPWLLCEGLVQCFVKLIENSCFTDAGIQWEWKYEADIIQRGDGIKGAERDVVLKMFIAFTCNGIHGDDFSCTFGRTILFILHIEGNPTLLYRSRNL